MYSREIVRSVYSDYKSSFNKLLDKDGFFTIRQKMSKFQPLEFINTFMAYLQGEVFKVNETIYGLRMGNKFYARNLKTVKFDTETKSINFSNLHQSTFNLTYCLKSSLLLSFCFLFLCMVDQTQMCPSSILLLGLFRGIICNIEGLKGGTLEP